MSRPTHPRGFAARPTVWSILAATLLTHAAGALASDTQWQLEEEQDGIAVYTRAIENSPFLEVKGTVSLNTPAQRVSDLMGDGNGCPEWRKTCKSSRVLEEISDAERYVYLVLDLPWPAADRDLVVHSRTVIDEDSQTAIVELVSDSSKLPPEDYVRAESQGRFVIRALGEQQVEFTYIMHTDLGGDLPPGAVNSRLAETTLDELVRLRKLAEG